ncbi:hypothetical protein ACFXJ5_34850 [Streptomyces sp. NPDC059373]
MIRGASAPGAVAGVAGVTGAVVLSAVACERVLIVMVDGLRST